MRSDYDPFACETVDWGSKTVHRVESLRKMTDNEVTAAVGDQSLERKISTTKRNGMDYKLVEVFVPVQWEGFEQPKAEPGVYKLGGF